MKRFGFFTLLLFTLNTSAVWADSQEECGVINIEQFRNTKSDAEIDEFPWMARVAFNSSYDGDIFVTAFRCLAVLISERYLISTARCVSGTHFDSAFAVLLGDWNSANDVNEEDCDTVTGKCCRTSLIEIDEIILHPSYSGLKRKHDIAMLRLIESVTYSNYIRPICLPNKEVANKEFGAEELKLTGWLQRVKGQKQKMSVFMYNQQDCRDKILAKNAYALSDVYMCGIADDVGVRYLSGAALMDVNDSKSQRRSAYLAGLLAYGTSSCTSRGRDVYIRVDPYLDWIRENIY